LSEHPSPIYSKEKINIGKKHDENYFKMKLHFIPDVDVLASVVIPSPPMVGAAVATFIAALSTVLLLLDLGILVAFLGFTGS
jgi:hypothetical protein